MRIRSRQAPLAQPQDSASAPFSVARLSTFCRFFLSLRFKLLRTRSGTVSWRHKMHFTFPCACAGLSVMTTPSVEYSRQRHASPSRVVCVTTCMGSTAQSAMSIRVCRCWPMRVPVCRRNVRPPGCHLNAPSYPNPARLFREGDWIGPRRSHCDRAGTQNPSPRRAHTRLSCDPRLTLGRPSPRLALTA